MNGEVTYLFQFDLKDSNGVTAEQKSELFKQLILDMGLGAKTNVGYGQFETTMSFEEIQTEIDRKNEEKEQRKLKIEKQRKKAKLTDREYKEFQGTSKTLNHKKGHFIEVIIESLDENFITVKDQEGSIYKKTIKNLENYFERTLARKQKKNPNLKLKPIAKGEELQLRFNEDLKHNSTDLNFTLLPIFEE